ncbi:8-amino-7-oxononanoate synthase [Streptomyces noursei]|uniref:8-amino-7-oxononanoate synthase n=1 Tax=Streptomyces noursei TaxID=1971 RepID=A0A401RCP5_STRNR|nr:8-amino-7-oxononanoate synthase [Streptomyces noursei]
MILAYVPAPGQGGFPQCPVIGVCASPHRPAAERPLTSIDSPQSRRYRPVAGSGRPARCRARSRHPPTKDADAAGPRPTAAVRRGPRPASGAAFDWIDEARAARHRAGLVRTLRPRPADSPVLDLAGNDYLGLARHPEVTRAAAEAAEGWAPARPAPGW